MSATAQNSYRKDCRKSRHLFNLGQFKLNPTTPSSHSRGAALRISRALFMSEGSVNYLEPLAKDAVVSLKSGSPTHRLPGASFQSTILAPPV